MQLDIFDRCNDQVALRNDVVDALERHDADAARAACERLAGEHPDDESLPALRSLIDALSHEAGPDFADHAALRRSRLTQLDTTAPAAHRIFKSRSPDWLRLRWHALARRAAALPFGAEHPDDHSAALWCLAGDWTELARSVTAIDSWRHIPVPLAWMMQARLRLDGLPAAWPLIAELAWLSPRRLRELAACAPAPLLVRLIRAFDAGFEGDDAANDLAWFPAWLVIDQPPLARHLAEARRAQHTPAEQAMRLLIELVGLERRGQGEGRLHEIVARRKSLRDLHAPLYAAYLRQRDLP